MEKIFFIFSFILFFSSLASAQCNFKVACGQNEVAILSLAKDGNAHGADYNFYQYKICCSNAIYSSIKTNCENGETEVIGLYKLNNSHASKIGESPLKLCVKFNYPMICILNSSCSGECIASLVKETNSHLGKCEDYPNKICCGNLTVTVEAGGPYVKDVDVPVVVVVGEVSFLGKAASFANLTIKIYEGNVLRAERSLTASSEGKYFALFSGLDIGIYMVEVNANYSFATASAYDIFKIVSKLKGCVPKTISLSGIAQDYLTGEIITEGIVKIYIRENGDEFSTTFSQGRWSVAFTSCLIPDERHVAIVQIIEPSGRISWSEVRFRV